LLSNAAHCERLTLLRLTPNMFEPAVGAEHGLRVKDPLNSFIRRCKAASQTAVAEEPELAMAS
jgi:hypothetical protein